MFYRSLPLNKKLKFYFAYLEAGEELGEGPLFGPSGELRAEPPLMEALDRRLRFSCVDARIFRRREGGFERLAQRPSRLQRRRRRRQLLEAFGEAELPIVDILFREGRFGETNFDALLATWWVIGLDFSEPPTDGVFCLAGDPWGETEDLTARLAWFRRVRPAMESRLRDVFSLAHVPDVGEEEDGPEGEPVEPLDPSPSGMVMTVDECSARLEEIELPITQYDPQERTWDELYAGRQKTGEAEQIMVRT